MDEKLNALRDFAVNLMRSGADLLTAVDGLKLDFDTENKSYPNYIDYCNILAKTRKSYREEVLKIDFGMHMSEEEKKLWNDILQKCKEEK